MTLKDLRLMLERDERQQNKLQQLSHELDPAQQLLVKRLANRPFFCMNIQEVNPKRPCFCHVIGLPEKNGIKYPIHPWQMELINDLERGTRYIVCKKARGIGFTSLMLYYLAYKAVCQNAIYSSKRFALIVGPREALAIDLIRRLKTLLLPLNIVDETEKTICRFLNVTVEAFPSARVSTLRGYDDLKIAYIDEASFFGSGAGNSKEEQEVRAVCEGYIAKTDLVIVMSSTPSVPGTMFENIMDESDASCMYKRYRLPYTVSLQKPGEPLSGIYSEAEISQARLSPNFERELNLAFGHGLGNVFLEPNIKRCITEYNQPSIQELANAVINVGADIGFSVSKTACVVSALLPSPLHTGESRAYILEASEFERVSFEHSIDIVASILRRYGYSAYRKNVICLVDGSRPEWVASLKSAVGEQAEFKSLLDYSIKYRVPLDSLMNIIPIQFGGEVGKQLLSHMQMMVSDGALAIAPRFAEFILQMRMAKTRVNGMLDKASNSLDLIDAASLSLWNVKPRL
jgi:hypothetical protein